MRFVAFAVILALAGSARADDTAELAKNAELAEAKRLEAALEYQPALVIVERVLASGDNDPDAVVALHLWAGRLAAGLDRTAMAEEHFAHVIALAPQTELPDGTSPKLTGPFDAARARTSPVRISYTTDRGVLVLSAEADELNLVAGVAVSIERDGKVSELREPRGRRVELPDPPFQIRVAALDIYGNRIWISKPGVMIDLTDRKKREHEPSRPLYARWIMWAGTSAAAFVVGGISAWRFDVAQDQWDRLKAAGETDFTKLRDIEDRGRRWGLAANISFGAAAITGLVAVIVYVKTKPYTGPQIVPNASSDAVGLAVAGGF